MPGSSHSSALDPLDLVKRSTEVVGDGCVLWHLDRARGQLQAHASWHRDPDLRSRLARLLDDPPLEPWEGAWIRQALATRVPIWLEEIEPEDLYQSGLEAEDETAEVVLQAIAADRAIVVYRDRLSAPFTDKARSSLQELLAEARLVDSMHSDANSIDLVETTSALIWSTDPRELVTYANTAFCRMIGLPLTQLVGLPLAEFLAEPPSRPRSGYLGQEPVECRLISSSGRETWVELTSRPCFDGDGRVNGLVHTAFDIDRRRQTEVSGRARRDSAQGLASLAEAILDPDGPVSVEDAVVEVVSEHLGPSLVVLLAVSGDLMESTVLAQAGSLLGHAEIKDTRYLLPARSLVRAAIEGGAAIGSSNFQDRRQDLQPGPLAQAVGARSAVCAPVADGGGVILGLRQEPGPISEQEVEFIGGAARLLALAWASESGTATDDSGPVGVQRA